MILLIGMIATGFIIGMIYLGLNLTDYINDKYNKDISYDWILLEFIFLILLVFQILYSLKLI